jgi:hypothetical protein
MTEQLHPMVPPNILLNNWESDWFAEREHADVLLTQAYQAGADAELEACCVWLKSEGHEYEHKTLFAARRPKPPSLKEQALAAAAELAGFKGVDIICKALEAIPDD